MADVRFTPTFHHVAWIDRVDRVEAGGPNGFNGRFRAIENDLRQFSTTVTDIGAALAAPASSGPPQSQLTFTPALNGVAGSPGWSTADNGSVFGLAADGGTTGLMNIVPPDGVTLAAFRVVGSTSSLSPSFGALSVTLARMPVRLTVPPPAPTTLATVSANSTTIIIDEQHTIPANLAPVDLSTFRYFVIAGYVDVISGAVSTATIDYLQLTFTTP